MFSFLKQKINEENKLPTLKDKINKFVVQYDNFYNPPTTIRDFVEKMAVWYEIRYPDYEIERNFGDLFYERRIDKTLIWDNPYISNIRLNMMDVIGEYRLDILLNFLIRIRWDEMISAHSFIQSLPSAERNILKKPKYPEQLSLKLFGFLEGFGVNVIVYLTSKGKIKKVEFKNKMNKELFDYDSIKNCHTIEELYDVLKKTLLNKKAADKVKNIISNYKKEVFLKNELIKTIMYRIIDRGQCRLGCQRAFIYAKDFNCDKKIPIQYSFLYQNKYLTKLIEYYLEQEDDLDIECYIIDEWGQLTTETLFSLIEQKCFLNENFYCNNPRIADLLNQYREELKVKTLANECVKKLLK